METREANETWEEYDPHKSLIKINLWRPNLFDLEEKALNPGRFKSYKRWETNSVLGCLLVKIVP